MPTKKQTPTQRILSLERQLANANDALEMALAVSPERDNNFFTGGMSGSYQDRTNWDRKKIFAESLRAWRVNPIARRIVRVIRSFIIGKGLTITSDDKYTNDWLQQWWNDPLNDFKKNVKRWKEEDTRTGNLFFLFTVQENFDTHIRAVAAENIEDIITTENDIEQETAYTKANEIGDDNWPAYQAGSDQKSFMMHFASNQPVGSPWGEPDLAPLLVWIGRYSSWLEDRVRLNKFRTAFMYVISGQYENEAERQKREAYLNANPPKSGSVLVLNRNNGEAWGILSARLDAFDANTDGIAIKKMVAAGIGQPMHWFAEPEDSTRTTAEAAGTPTFRTLEEEQDDFFNTIIRLAQVALTIKARHDKKIKPEAAIKVKGPDITERDNATLALALGRAYPALSELFDRGAIKPEEFLRLAYKMFAEVWEGPAPKIKKKPLQKTSETAPPDPGVDDTDPKEETE